MELTVKVIDVTSGSARWSTAKRKITTNKNWIWLNRSSA
jgi:hypothetical protein